MCLFLSCIPVDFPKLVLGAWLSPILLFTPLICCWPFGTIALYLLVYSSFALPINTDILRDFWKSNCSVPKPLFVVFLKFIVFFFFIGVLLSMWLSVELILLNGNFLSVLTLVPNVFLLDAVAPTGLRAYWNLFALFLHLFCSKKLAMSYFPSSSSSMRFFLSSISTFSLASSYLKNDIFSRSSASSFDYFCFLRCYSSSKSVCSTASMTSRSLSLLSVARTSISSRANSESFSK